jgi:hypothetical protein
MSNRFNRRSLIAALPLALAPLASAAAAGAPP